jgi:hypothetical protein
LPKQIVEVNKKKKHPKSSILSRFFNFCVEVFLGFHFFLIVSSFVLMPIAFICVVIIGAPIIWFNLSRAYDFVLSSIGWKGVAEALLAPLGLFFGLRLLWLWKGLHYRNKPLTFSKLRCVISHDYVKVGGHEEPSDPMFDYDTVDLKCRRCSSTESETTAYSNDFR